MFFSSLSNVSPNTQHANSTNLTKRRFNPKIVPPAKRNCTSNVFYEDSQSDHSDVDTPSDSISDDSLPEPYISDEEESEEGEYDEITPAIFTDEEHSPQSLSELDFNVVLHMNEADFILIRDIVFPEIPEPIQVSPNVPTVSMENGRIVVNDTIIKAHDQVVSKKIVKKKITKQSMEERLLFYIGIRLFGHDIQQISKLFPERLLSTIKSWYKRERKKHDAMLKSASPLYIDGIEEYLPR